MDRRRRAVAAALTVALGLLAGPAFAAANTVQIAPAMRAPAYQLRVTGPAGFLFERSYMAGQNVAVDAPETEFVRPCNLCPHMKRISLENIYQALLHDQFEVTVDEAVAERARAAVQRMVDLPPPAVPARYDMVKARHHVDVELI